MIMPTLEDLQAMRQARTQPPHVLTSSTQPPLVLTSSTQPPHVLISSTQDPLNFPTAAVELREDFLPVFTTAPPYFSPTPAVPGLSQSPAPSTNFPSPRLPPVLGVDNPKLRFTTSTEAEVPETTEFTFMPTPMPKKTSKKPFSNRLSVFQFQPTPMTKKFRFKPTKGKKEDPRTLRKLEELFNDPKINSIELSSRDKDFAQKFEVDPDMKDNFAIVKVKNHKLLEKLLTEQKPTVAEKLFSKSLLENKAMKVEKTEAPGPTLITKPQEKLKDFVPRKPTRNRGRLVKKVKSRGQINQGVLRNMKDQKTRRRLQFIKRGKIVPKFRGKSRGNSIPVTENKERTREPRISVTVSHTVSDGSRVVSSSLAPSVVHVGSLEGDAREKDEEADRRVQELTDNILELKAKLELLRQELSV